MNECLGTGKKGEENKNSTQHRLYFGNFHPITCEHAAGIHNSQLQIPKTLTVCVTFFLSHEEPPFSSVQYIFRLYVQYILPAGLSLEDYVLLAQCTLSDNSDPFI